MIAYAAIDLRGGRVVQLVGGRPEAERISLPSPADVARRWIDAGFTALHVVDLDAALGDGDNDDAISDILAAAASAASVQVGGGVRTSQRVQTLLERGAARIVVGTRAIEDADWRGRLAARFPGRVIIAADVRDEQVVIRGWTAAAGITADTLLRKLAPLPLAAVLVTDVAREGSMIGADVPRFKQLGAAAAHPLIASGGVGGESDLYALRSAGMAGVVLGMALYTGALNGTIVAREFAT